MDTRIFYISILVSPCVSPALQYLHTYTPYKLVSHIRRFHISTQMINRSSCHALPRCVADSDVLQMDLYRLTEYCETNCLYLNVTKCQTINFTGKIRYNQNQKKSGISIQRFLNTRTLSKCGLRCEWVDAALLWNLSVNPYFIL